MITQAFYPINPLYVTVISIYSISKNSITSQQANICSESTIETSARHEKCLKLNIKRSEWLQRHRPVFVVNFEHNLQLVLVLLLFVNCEQVVVSCAFNTYVFNKRQSIKCAFNEKNNLGTRKFPLKKF